MPRTKRTGRVTPSIPWSQEGFLAAFAHWQTLLDAPAAARRESTMSSYFAGRYGARRGLLHFTRWLKIGDLLARHIGRLQREGLVWAGPGGALEMRPELITALCRAPLGPRGLALADVLEQVRAPRRKPRGTRRKVDRE